MVAKPRIVDVEFEVVRTADSAPDIERWPIWRRALFWTLFLGVMIPLGLGIRWIMPFVFHYLFGW